MNSRWADYFLTDRFTDFWAKRLAEPSETVCLLFGLGFDPRCIISLQKLSQIAAPGQLSYVALQLQTLSPDVPPGKLLHSLVKENTESLAKVSNATCIAKSAVVLQDAGRYPVGGRSALNFIGSIFEQLTSFRHIVIDISGVPRSVFYPLISFLCKRADQGLLSNVHVAVLDDAELDSKIRLSEFGDADYIHTFRLEGSKKMVWLPVIGSHERDRILKIFAQIKSDCVETCPILPFPASPLRKPDDILIENSDVLYQELGITPGNIILCDERNPFDIYRKILNVHDYYSDKLAPLMGEITTVVSPLSSKLLSLGMLLAAIERHLPVSYVEAGLYSIEEKAFQFSTLAGCEPLEVWLTGEPYIEGNGHAEAKEGK
jgi:hypothetical protein